MKKQEKLKDAQVVRYTDSFGFGFLIYNESSKNYWVNNVEMAGLNEYSYLRPNSPRLMYLYAE